MGHWSNKTRETLRPVWLAVENREITDRKELEKIIFDLYPFGVREMSPYKTWLGHRKKLLARFDTLHKTSDGPKQVRLFGGGS